MAKSEDCPPSAESLVLSMRAMGYNLQTAISDLIDNSIFAKCKNVWVDYSWSDGKPWVMITDDGRGMDENTLRKAMKPGSSSPTDYRDEEDLGRFGLGLKTASWSQCKIMTVMSKTKSGETSVRRWDLDYVVKKESWKLLKEVDEDSLKLLSSRIESAEFGTAVLWQNLDRIIDSGDFHAMEMEEMESEFNQKFTETVIPYLEMTFHRFISGRGSISLHVGRTECSAWDPFLSSHSQTEERPPELFDDKSISVTPFILPHTSHLSTEEMSGAEGIGGWMRRQGFYVYRRKRMIIAGGYLGLKDNDGKELQPKDHYRLCRIRVDLPNDIDDEWDIDVRKASASPPLRLKKDFERLAESTRRKSSNVFRRRTIARSVPRSKSSNYEDVWRRKKVGPKVMYKVNRKNPAIIHIRDSADISHRTMNALLHLIERTVPYRGITVDNNDLVDSTVDLPEDLVEPPKELIEYAKEMVRLEIASGKDPKIAVDYICKFKVPLDSPQLRVALDTEFLGG